MVSAKRRPCQRTCEEQLGRAWRVLEASAELESQGRSHQAHAARALWGWVVGTCHSWPEAAGAPARRGTARDLAAAAVGEALGRGARGQKVREDHGPVFAA